MVISLYAETACKAGSVQYLFKPIEFS